MLYSDYLEFLRNEALRESVFITRHEPCITLGKNSTPCEIVQQSCLPVFETNRGGGATYHDMGQLVLYPRLNLRLRQIALREYITLLENWFIEALAMCQVFAFRGFQPGLWVLKGDVRKKIVFIGLAVKNGFSEHGAAINLQGCCVENFSRIIPCKSFEKIGLVDVAFSEFASAIITCNPFSDLNISYL